MTRSLLLLACLTVLALAADNPVDIVRRSLDRDNRNWERAKDYTFQETSTQRQYDTAGKVKKTESTTHDITILYGRPLPRLVQKNGKPLTPKEKTKEDERVDQELEKRRRASEDENSKERKKYEQRRAEQRKFLDEIPQAFDFTLKGTENFGGHPAWIITAEPKPGFRPHDARAKFLSKMRGKLWIDQKEYQWVRVEAETTDNISFGWFLARLGPGALLRFEQQRVNDEVWLPSRGFIKLDARALWKTLRGEIDIEYRDYRKFRTDSKIVIPETPGK